MPLIVLTADRPPELRGIGAGQTIDQIKLYGDAVRWFFEVGNARRDAPSASTGSARWPAARCARRDRRATRARCTSTGGCASRSAPAGTAPLTAGRPGGRPWVALRRRAAGAGRARRTRRPARRAA